MKVITRYRLGNMIGTLYETSLRGELYYEYRIRYNNIIKIKKTASNGCEPKWKQSLIRHKCVFHDIIKLRSDSLPE